MPWNGQERHGHVGSGRQTSRPRKNRAHHSDLFSLDETFDVGKDTGTPVVEDYVNKMPFGFTGELTKVVVQLGKSGLTASDLEQLDEANKMLSLVRD